jgi:hypothetical protein
MEGYPLPLTTFILGGIMNITKILMTSILLTVLVAGCASTKGTNTVKAPLPPGTLNATEVTVLFSGKSVRSVLDENGRVSLTYYNPNGELRQVRKGNMRSGTWQVNKDGRICLQFEGKKKRCRIIVNEGPNYSKYIVKRDGNHQRIVTYTTFNNGNLVDP